MHGLQVAGSDAVPALVQLLQEPATALEVVTGAADAIGECATTPEHMGAAVAAGLIVLSAKNSGFIGTSPLARASFTQSDVELVRAVVTGSMPWYF